MRRSRKPFGLFRSRGFESPPLRQVRSSPQRWGLFLSGTVPKSTSYGTALRCGYTVSRPIPRKDDHGIIREHPGLPARQILRALLGAVHPRARLVPEALRLLDRRPRAHRRPCRRRRLFRRVEPSYRMGRRDVSHEQRRYRRRLPQERLAQRRHHHRLEPGVGRARVPRRHDPDHRHRGRADYVVCRHRVRHHRHGRLRARCHLPEHRRRLQGLDHLDHGRARPHGPAAHLRHPSRRRPHPRHHRLHHLHRRARPADGDRQRHRERDRLLQRQRIGELRGRRAGPRAHGTADRRHAPRDAHHRGDRLVLRQRRRGPHLYRDRPVDAPVQRAAVGRQRRAAARRCACIQPGVLPAAVSAAALRSQCVPGAQPDALRLRRHRLRHPDARRGRPELPQPAGQPVPAARLAAAPM